MLRQLRALFRRSRRRLSGQQNAALRIPGIEPLEPRTLLSGFGGPEGFDRGRPDRSRPPEPRFGFAGPRDFGRQAEVFRARPPAPSPMRREPPVALPAAPSPPSPAAPASSPAPVPPPIAVSRPIAVISENPPPSIFPAAPSLAPAGPSTSLEIGATRTLVQRVSATSRNETSGFSLASSLTSALRALEGPDRARAAAQATVGETSWVLNDPPAATASSDTPDDAGQAHRKPEARAAATEPEKPGSSADETLLATDPEREKLARRKREKSEWLADDALPVFGLWLDLDFASPPTDADLLAKPASPPRLAGAPSAAWRLPASERDALVAAFSSGAAPHFALRLPDGLIELLAADHSAGAAPYSMPADNDPEPALGVAGRPSLPVAAPAARYLAFEIAPPPPSARHAAPPSAACHAALSVAAAAPAPSPTPLECARANDSRPDAP